MCNVETRFSARQDYGYNVSSEKILGVYDLRTLNHNSHIYTSIIISLATPLSINMRYNYNGLLYMELGCRGNWNFATISFFKFVIIAVFVLNISLVAMTLMYKSNKSRWFATS